MIRGMIAGLLAAFIALPAPALVAPASAQQVEGRWEALQNNPKCQVWNSAPVAQETVTWSGRCVDSKATGEGTLTWRWSEDGAMKTSTFSGVMRAGKLEGAGTYTLTGGDRYEGNFRDSQFNGRGVYVWAGGARYEGEFRDSRFNGQGVLIWENGDRYEGEFRDDKREGRGVYIWANGQRYEGEFRDGHLHGRGVFTWGSGNRYEGDYRDNLPNGFGESRIDGNRYAGTWTNGCFEDGPRLAWVNVERADCGF